MKLTVSNNENARELRDLYEEYANGRFHILHIRRYYGDDILYGGTSGDRFYKFLNFLVGHEMSLCKFFCPYTDKLRNKTSFVITIH